VRSKTIAERAAWDLVREAGASKRLAVVNPGAILGPALSDDHSFSLQMVERLLKGTPGNPRIGFSVVDVRDVADLHIRAMTDPAAGGERFLATADFLWVAEMAAILRANLGDAASKVPKRNVPDFLVRLMGRFDPGVRSIVNQLGEKVTLSSAKAESELGWVPRSAEQAVVDCGRSLAGQNAS
jgi:dihydroflavonol-4-reductase